MKSIDIWFENIPYMAQRMWAAIRTLYLDILHEDDKWHFFYEGSFIHIRCQDQFVETVIECIKSSPIIAGVTHIDGPTDWKDDHEVVEKYKWYFEQYFHMNSVLALELYKDHEYPSFLDFYTIYDRVAHCLPNTWFHIAERAVPENRITPFELALVTYYQTMRAKFTGKYEYYRELVDDRTKEASK